MPESPAGKIVAIVVVSLGKDLFRNGRNTQFTSDMVQSRHPPPGGMCALMESPIRIFQKIIICEVFCPFLKKSLLSLGLPLLLIYLSVTGAGLAKLVKKLYTIMCCCKNKNITENLAMSHRNNGSTGSSQGTSNTAKSSAIGSGKSYQNSKQQQIQIQQYLQQCRSCHQKSKVHISDSVPGMYILPKKN